MKRLAVQVGEYQVGRFGGDERATVQRLGPESPNAVLGIVHERHPQTLSRPGKFEAARKRYAHLTEQHTSKVVARMNERIFGDGSGQ